MSLRDELTAPAGTWTDEVETVLRRLPSETLSKWEVYDFLYESRPSQCTSDEQYKQVPRYDYPSNSVQLAYLPDSIQPTRWIGQTNQINIRHKRGYLRRFDVDPDDDHEKSEDEPDYEFRGKEPKYVVTGLFVDPFVTGSVDKVLERLEAEMLRVSEATEVNAEIERLAKPDYWADIPGETLSEDPGDYTEQSSPIASVRGFSDAAIRELSQQFGSYYNTTLAQERGVKAPPRRIEENITDAIGRYNRFRQREDWGRVDIVPQMWAEYPKKPLP